MYESIIRTPKVCTVRRTFLHTVRRLYLRFADLDSFGGPFCLQWNRNVPERPNLTNYAGGVTFHTFWLFWIPGSTSCFIIVVVPCRALAGVSSPCVVRKNWHSCDHSYSRSCKYEWERSKFSKNYDLASFNNSVSKFRIKKGCLIVKRFTDCNSIVNLKFVFLGFEMIKGADAQFAVVFGLAMPVPTILSMISFKSDLYLAR